MLFIHFNCIKQVTGDPFNERRRLNDDESHNNLASPSLESIVSHQEIDEFEDDYRVNSPNSSNDDQSTSEFVSHSTSSVITTLVNPLKRKKPLSSYWENFPGASSSPLAEVNIKISKKVMALWKGQNTERSSIEITLEITDLDVFGKFLS